MRDETIKQILDEKTKKRKKKKPIGRLYSIRPVFSDATIGTPEGMVETTTGDEFNCMYISDNIRYDEIKTALSDDFWDDDEFYSEDDLYETEWLIKALNKETHIDYYELFVPSCWSALLNKPEYGDLTKIEAITKLVQDRLSLIGNKLNLNIADWSFNNNVLNVKFEKLSNAINEGLNLPKRGSKIMRFPEEWINQSVSHGTYRPEDIIESLLGILNQYTWTNIIDEQISKFVYQFQILDRDDYNDIIDRELVYDLQDNIIDFVGNLVPIGTYFGTHDGDDTNFGFWEHEDDEDDDIEWGLLCPNCGAGAGVVQDFDRGTAHCHNCNTEFELPDEELQEGLNLPKKRQTNIPIKDLESGEIRYWTIEEILDEINRDRSETWTDYNESDWEEGWDAWIEGDFYTRFIEPSELREGLNLPKRKPKTEDDYAMEIMENIMAAFPDLDSEWLENKPGYLKISLDSTDPNFLYYIRFENNGFTVETIMLDGTGTETSVDYWTFNIPQGMSLSDLMMANKPYLQQDIIYNLKQDMRDRNPIQEGLNLPKKRPLPYRYFEIHVCLDYYNNSNDCSDGYSQFLKVPQSEIPNWYPIFNEDEITGEMFHYDDGKDIIQFAIKNKKFNQGDWDDIDYMQELTKEEYLQYTGKKETELDEIGGLSDTLGANTSQNVPKWESGITRGHANPIDVNKPWESGITRGKANSLFEGLNLPPKTNPELKKGDYIRIMNGINKSDIWKVIEIVSSFNLYDVKYYIIQTESEDGKLTAKLYPETDKWIKIVGLQEGLNIPKKVEPAIFGALDNSLVNVKRSDEPGMGKNVFRFYPDKNNQNMLIKALVYPSGKVTILQHRISFITNIMQEFNITREAFDAIFQVWFYSRYGDQIITEGLNLTKQNFEQEPITVQDIIEKYNAQHWIYNPEWYQLLPESIKMQIPHTYYYLGYIAPIDGFLVQFKSHYDPKFIGVDVFVVKDGEIINVWSGYLNANKGMTHFDMMLQKRLQNSRNKLTEGLNLPKRPQGVDKFPDDWCGEILSDGTLQPSHLIPKYLTYLSLFTWSPKIQDEVVELEREWEILEDMISNNVGQDVDHLEKQQWILQDLCDLMSDLAPKGCWFGASEGDGALFGFWEYEDETEDDEPDYTQIVQDL